MRKETDIDALMAETWLTVTLLKQGATTPDGNVLYDTCCKHVESVREALDRAGYDEASVDHISYAQCALLDEVVMSRKLPNMAVLTCYHRVLALGFQGLYSMGSVSQTQREEAMKALAERVPPLDAGLSLVVRRTGKHRYSLLRSVWFWIAAAAVITGAVWWGGHLWLQALLSAQLPELPH